MKFLILVGLSFVLVLLLCSGVFAYRRLCLSEGQSVPSQEDPRYTCHYDTCQVCVTDDFYPTLPARCNHIESCQQLSSSSTVSEDDSATESGINTIQKITPSPSQQTETSVSSPTEPKEIVEDYTPKEEIAPPLDINNPVPTPSLPQQKNVPQNNNFFILVSMSFTILLTIILVGLLVINYRGKSLFAKEKSPS